MQKDINRLKVTANERRNWALESEVNPDSTARKMMKKAQHVLKRIDKSVSEKQSLLKNIEIESPLKFNYQELKYPKVLLQVVGLSLKKSAIVVPKVDFKIEVNQVVSLMGPNGIGKSSMVKSILGLSHFFEQSGDIQLVKGLKISYLRQDNELQGTIRQLAEQKQIEPELIFSNLRKLGFERYLFEQPIEQMSQGQRRKVALAVSLSEKANLYFWDEPLNYLDVITRQQIIEAIKKQHPTMLLIDHDQDLIDSVSSAKVYLHY
ncbi:hypothetical protein LKI01_17870 [Companilactobacillus paralimentarius]|nr:hypothetical protein LKI01_17870 [Companilactobacillus paralimentarius]